MRLSINRDDPGYRAYKALPANVAPKITLDGQEVGHVLTADTRLGYILACKLDAQGWPQLNARKTEILRQQLRGAVAIDLVRRA